MGIQYKPIPKTFTPEFNPEALVKATKKVLNNLEKDPAYYTNAISAEFEKKSGLLQHPKELKLGPDGRAPIPGFKDAKANTQTTLSKKERAKGSIPQGVKEMKPSNKASHGMKIMKDSGRLPKGVKLMKEYVDLDPDITAQAEIQGDLKESLPTETTVSEVIEALFDGDFDNNPSKLYAAKRAIEASNHPDKDVSLRMVAKKWNEAMEHETKGQIAHDEAQWRREGGLDEKKQVTLKKLREYIAKSIKEDLYTNTKTGQTQSFDQSNPSDKRTMSDPKFNQTFKKAE
jgi:hypothetical protein